MAHEYFHNIDVKRIRPVALGPFDHSRENVTNMLWVAEGITEYYGYLLVRRAGLITDRALFDTYSAMTRRYENTPGHLYQSATQASHDVWQEQPYQKMIAEAARTISYYDKGCMVGLLLDLKIRHEKGNKSSLDDVMQLLYKKYY